MTGRPAPWRWANTTGRVRADHVGGTLIETAEAAYQQPTSKTRSRCTTGRWANPQAPTRWNQRGLALQPEMGDFRAAGEVFGTSVAPAAHDEARRGRREDSPPGDDRRSSKRGLKRSSQPPTSSRSKTRAVDRGSSSLRVALQQSVRTKRARRVRAGCCSWRPNHFRGAARGNDGALRTGPLPDAKKASRDAGQIDGRGRYYLGLIAERGWRRRGSSRRRASSTPDSSLRR